MITGQSLRTMGRIIIEARGAHELMFIARRGRIAPEREAELGLNLLIQDGDAIQPAGVGRVTEYNARGREIKLKDLPLVTKHIPMYRSWQDWHGYPHSGIQIHARDVYQVRFLTPPGEDLTLRVIDGNAYIATRLIQITDDPQVILHLANLMLECFGEFEVFDNQRQQIAHVPVRQLHWELLPQGRYPWNVASGIVDPYIQHLKPSEKGVVEYRMREITSYEPDFVATGRGGYQGYFVYGFTDRNLYLLESIYLNNATYVFGTDWQELSGLTKAEIINGGHEHDRIIHDQHWDSSVRRLMRPGEEFARF
ncbi:hypothetical protein [Pseudomonas sp. ESBL2]|uniref:hypothetical protein n=1 Tax=Pseudomonas sp. ESBL2 TaxID=3077325 RepID=UPI002FC61EAA